MNKENKQLVWNVYADEWNKGIAVHNVFDHCRFWDDLVKVRKKYGKLRNYTEADKVAFEEAVHRLLMYYYWAKCEWEIVLTPWPPVVTETRCDEAAWDKFYRLSEKVDVYEQVNNNWDQFIRYLWENRRLIKKREVK